jgi:hypothetical protein
VSLLKPPDLGQVFENNPRNLLVVQSQYQPFTQQLPDTPSSAPSIARSPAQGPQMSSSNGDSLFPDALLNTYRHNMAPQFPFVIVPDRVPAAELAQTKPFLCKTLLMVASYHDKAGQIRMTRDIFQYLSSHMIVENERSFDLLQGLLVLMAWSV